MPILTSRQVEKFSSHDSGEPTSTPPSPPTAITSPLIRGNRASG
ncbi:Uncharacterised protein [Bordetella pertussis]|nr:Uncharacterised protein [Bordetella pertussis]CFP12848.1 Uncharacterised protein [Bordetella pertussis]SUV87675.1 Uncharacterised protein [Bordetella pertussis]